MGVPSFFKWLVTKYPNIMIKAPVQNPDSGFSNFDNLYLDMNNIIHPCFHPEDPAHPFPPTTFDQVHAAMFEYIDHIFSIVRPRKLVYMAVDGVGPRAKMNQQRARRFRSAKDNDAMEEEEDVLRKQFETEGKQLLPKMETEVSDSNIITPGTEFMFHLSKKLEQYVTSRMETCPGWKDVKVVLSDSNVPGEGEHKIMSFIRHQRSLPGYNPNTRHCIYGLVPTTVFFDVMTVKEEQPICLSALKSSLSKVEGREFKSRGWFKNVKTEGEKPSTQPPSFIRKPYQFLQIWTLRDYLEIDMNIPDPPEKFSFDLERAIDDFVFICSFAGNDFLPHMPTLEIHEGAIDLLMTVYKQHFKSLGGYLLDMERVHDPKNGFIKLKRVEKFILEVGKFEDKIFKKRSELKDRILEKIAASFLATTVSIWLLLVSFLFSYDVPKCIVLLTSFLQENEDEISDSSSTSNGTALAPEEQVLKNTMELKEKLRASIRKKSDLFKNGGPVTDKVKLGSDGYKRRYYEEKFSAETTTKDVVCPKVYRRVVVGSTILLLRSSFMEMVRKLLYETRHFIDQTDAFYVRYYPYNYGPFASDLKGLAQVKVKFQKGSPFRPFEQLMAVLPPRSVHALPKPYHKLMTDVKSNIIDFYPTDFVIDMHGKRFSYQGICELPFVDEQLLLAEANKVEKELKPHEIDRNKQNTERLYMRTSSLPDDQLVLLVSSLNEQSPKNIDISLCGIGGLVRLSPEEFDMDRMILCVFFELPTGSSNHIPRPLEGTTFPDKTITEADIEEAQLWHDIPVRRYTNSNWHRSNWRSTHGEEQQKQQYYNKNLMNSNSSSFRNSYVPTKRFTAYNPPPTSVNIKIPGPSGSGFSSGRGRGSANPPPPAPAPAVSSNAWSQSRSTMFPAGHGQQNVHSGYNYNYNKNLGTYGSNRNIGWRQPMQFDNANSDDASNFRGNYSSRQGYGRGNYVTGAQGYPAASWNPSRRET
ncbi:5'-3' exoribonuclease 3 [Linum perenne]